MLYEVITYVNHQFTKLFGYTVEDVPDLKTWHKKAYTDLKYKDRITSYNVCYTKLLRNWSFHSGFA